MTNPVQPGLHPRAERDRNPGDLRPRGHQPQWPGMSEVDNNPPDPPYATFPTNAKGWCGLGLWLLYAHYVEGKITTTSKIEVFAPPSDDNDTSAYAAGIAEKVGENADPLDPAVRKAMSIAISKWESSTQWPESDIDEGITDSTQEWPTFYLAITGKEFVHVLTPPSVEELPTPPTPPTFPQDQPPQQKTEEVTVQVLKVRETPTPPAAPNTSYVLGRGLRPITQTQETTEELNEEELKEVS
jgi:hypothetical protein